MASTTCRGAWPIKWRSRVQPRWTGRVPCLSRPTQPATIGRRNEIWLSQSHSYTGKREATY